MTRIVYTMYRQIREIHLRVRTKDAFIFRCNVYGREEGRYGGKRKRTHTLNFR